MQDPEFKHALTSLQIRGFPPDKFIRWVCWRTGLPKDTYAHLDLERYPSTESVLLEYPNLPETISKCFEDYLPISDIFAAISPMGRHFGWAHLPLETEEFQTFCKKYAPSELPSTKVLSWLIGALPFYNLSDPVVVSHKDEQAITRPLPGTPKRINLTLLKGNLGDENANSHVVNKVLQQLDSTLPSLHYLIGVSGAGKTKALFDIGRKNVSIYFDFKNGELEDSLKKNVVKNLNDVQYIQKTEYEIGVLYATRLVLLMIMKLKNPGVTNEQLLLVQINGYSQERRSWYSTINGILRGAFKERADIETVIDVAYFFLGITKATLFILCDEAQELLPIADGKFKLPDNSEDQSLFHKLVSETIGYGNAIVAGTSLALIYFEHLKSVTAKPRGQEIIKAKHADFKYITSAADCRQLVERLFDVRLSDDHVQYILHKLQGRARFIVNLTEVAQLAQYKKSNHPGKSNEEILMDIVDALFHHLTTVNRELQDAGIPDPYTPAAIINSNFDKERQAYANLIGIYYFDKKELPDIESGSKFFSNGLVGVAIPSGEDTRYQITEPLIVTAILNTFKRKQQSVAAEYLGSIFERVERAITLEMGTSKSIQYNEMSIPALSEEIGIFKPTSITEMSIRTYLQSKSPEDFIIHLLDKEHPDMCYFSDGILWLFSCKTTRNSCGVEQREVTDCYNSTDIQKFASVKTIEEKLQDCMTLQKAQQQEVVNSATKATSDFLSLIKTFFHDGRLKKVMRVHFLFPRASSTCKEIGNGEWELDEDTVIPFSSINVTSQSVNSYNLFSKLFSAKLLHLFGPKENELANIRKKKSNKRARDEEVVDYQPAPKKPKSQIIEEKSGKEKKK